MKGINTNCDMKRMKGISTFCEKNERDQQQVWQEWKGSTTSVTRMKGWTTSEQEWMYKKVTPVFTWVAAEWVWGWLMTGNPVLKNLNQV